MRKLVITIQPDISDVNCNENIDVKNEDLSLIEILDYLRTVSACYARLLLEEYKDVTGDLIAGEQDLNDYIDSMRMVDKLKRK